MPYLNTGNNYFLCLLVRYLASRRFRLLLSHPLSPPCRSKTSAVGETPREHQRTSTIRTRPQPQTSSRPARGTLSVAAGSSERTCMSMTWIYVSWSDVKYKHAIKEDHPFMKHEKPSINYHVSSVSRGRRSTPDEGELHLLLNMVHSGTLAACWVLSGPWTRPSKSPLRV